LAWRIEYTANALDQLRRLDRQISKRILDYMDRRIAPLTDPRSAGKPLTGPFGGFWRYRVGDYRIVCAIETEALRVLVVRIGHRSGIYRG